MARQLFGTDGIRGKAGDPPLDKPTAYALGAALGGWAKAKSSTPKVLLGMDTRESGPWLAEAVAAGLVSAGVEPHFAGLLTTPGVAYNTKHGPYVAGVMISASHNPYQDNGLKVFDHSGFKLPDAQELILEEEILRIRENAIVPDCPLPFHEELANHYLDFLASTFPHSLKGLRVVLDCANGAASLLAPRLFTQLGAEVITIANSPDGRNINAGVGALHTDHVRAAVLEHKADIGIAFDGDADRAMFKSASGTRIDGDAVLLICARLFQASGHLPGNKVVATVMSNLGLEVALRNEGITLARTNVGDKYVLEEMIRSGSNLGGEQSGHVIFPEFATTGDGMLTALRVLEAMVTSGKSLDQLTHGFVVFPQLLVNVRIGARRPLEELPDVQSVIAECEKDFGSNGRVLVRFSGTEPLARVMVEGNDEAKVEFHAHAIAATLQQAMGIK
ncbi:MAG: phosphoglucosamine mutase [Acidobacteria bacterium]|nr:phosphoglucosamine mutase [Acidobacteriota bacterium]